MENKDVYTTVKNIVLRVSKNRHDIADIGDNEILTGEKVNLDASELVYIVVELMEHYKITFKAEDFENYRFNSISEITSIVKHRINHEGVK